MTEMRHSDMDIIIPFYNPLVKWVDDLLNSYTELNKLIHDTNINLILVNDGSTVNLSNKDLLVLEKNIKNFIYVSYKQNKGKGYALREGIQRSHSRYVVMTDIDFPYRSEYYVEIVRLLQDEKYDVVSCRRDNKYYDNLTIERKYVSRILQSIIKYCFSLKTSDTQAGLIGINSKAKDIFLNATINRYLYSFEFTILYSRSTDIRHTSILADPRENLLLSKLNTKILLSEIYDLLRIIYLYKLK